MPSEAALAGFRSAVSILYKPGEFPATLFGNKDTDGSGDILDLTTVQDPESLPSYWTLSVPGWYHPDMGNIHVPKLPDIPGVRSHHQDVCLDGATISNCDVFLEPSPFLIFEVDYLLVGGKVPTTPEVKKLQREAMAYAFQAAGFPFAVLTDSGGKSIHATIRLENSLDEIAQWRASPEFDRLQDLAFVVFGHFDQGVMKQSGKARLVRTPGARRDDGSPQSILATGQRVSIHDLTKWFADQLNPETQQEVWSRQPVTKADSPLRQHYLRLEKWRKDLMQPAVKGERGERWRWISNSLIAAGCVEPRVLLQPSAQAPYGQWQASWLWHVSAYTFNHYTSGWFFSHDQQDWQNRDERVRWEATAKRQQVLAEQLKFEGATDPSKNLLVDQMMATQQAVQPQALPLPPQVGPPVHTGGVTGATLTTDPNAKPGEKPKKKSVGYEVYAEKFFSYINQKHIIKCSSLQGDSWYVFNPKIGIWKQVSPDYIKAVIQNCVLENRNVKQATISEIFGMLQNLILYDEQWVEFPRAIAFQNGTLYILDDEVVFKPEHDPLDKLRSMVPCHYDPSAQCPRWENFVRWALPDPSRLSLLQEAFGYTLIPGQPFQSFFMMTGTGSNGKSVVLAVLQALHKDSFETVALANLGGRFSLGTLGRKRLAIDTEAENVVNAVSGEGNSATAILKSWTGGDPVKIEAKRIQGWSETINAKYFMSCNKKPRFVDPTKGVWRRLKLLKFEATIEERQADTTLGSKLINQELPGIVNWAVSGLRRLYTQNGFTQSDSLRGDLAEYQIDSDSVALFVQDFMRLAVGDSANAWFDIRPFHKAYKDRCLEAGNSPVSETEFRQRLEMLNVAVGRPGEQESVNGCPAGFERAPGLQHWSIRGWRCYHPAYTTQSLVGSYTQAQSIQSAPMIMQGAR